ncbi:MAG: proline--tRNA ligase [Candidatus Hadarchaeales archaeon]
MKEFTEWFERVLTEAELVDTRYPGKGMYVWLPYGMKLRNLVVGLIRELLDRSGHQEVLFPLLIPEDQFSKEAEHIRGFENQVFWVTRGGGADLDVKLVLRPTSETAMYPMFALWIRSHTDLPLKLYQIVSVFRCETKMTKPLIRVREVTTFKEAHTVHATAEEAENQVREALEIYRKFFDLLGIPYLITRRPPWDTFAGAEYSIAFDTLSPEGNALQIGTVHNLGQKFSKVFDIKYLDKDGTHKFVHQTCYGISERVIASLIFIHGDELGPCFPPLVAPVQVVVVPIPYADCNPTPLAREVKNRLQAAGLRVELDEGDRRPGEKFYFWEKKGVPLRIEVGPKELREGKVTLVPRDTRERTEVPMNELEKKVEQTLGEIERRLKERAKQKLESSLIEVSSPQELRKEGRVLRVFWCGRRECAERMEVESGMSVLGTEVGGTRGKCLMCGGEGESALLAKSY